jgi:hypothetical protein
MPNNSHQDTRTVEDEGVEVQDSQVLATLEKASIDMQIQTAKAYPRSIQKFKREAMELATLDAETAGTMFYRLPRSGKTIEGPSVRMAEVVGSAWGNLRYGGRIVGIDEGFIVAQGMAFDLEKNIASTIEVRRRITDRWGKRYNDDMIQVTGNAAIAIAQRNAIFKVVPFGMVKSIWEKAKEVSLGKDLTMEQRRQRAMAAMEKLGAKPADVFKVLNIKGAADLTIDDLLTLQGMVTAIQDRETTWENIVREAAQSDPKPTSLDDVDVAPDKPRTVQPEVVAEGSGKSAGKQPPPPQSASTADPALTKAQRKDLADGAVALGVEGLDLVRTLNEVAVKIGLESFEKMTQSKIEAFNQALQETVTA